MAMSATVEAERTAALLGGGGPAVPVVDGAGRAAPGRRPLEPTAAGRAPLRRPRGDAGVPRPRGGHDASRAGRAGRRRAGLRAGRRARSTRSPAASPASVTSTCGPLHGRLTTDEQDLALSEGPRRRVVVSTAVAESSLTVPGVRTVVDAGLSREPRTDHRRGLAGLVTVRVSRAAAEQRAGRAGREGPGAVYRCWSQAEHAHLAAHPLPEIADRRPDVVRARGWRSGVRPGGVGLALLDQPPVAALDAALATLRRPRRARRRRSGDRRRVARSPRSAPTPAWPARCSTGRRSSAPVAPRRWSRCSPRTCGPRVPTWWRRCARRGAEAGAWATVRASPGRPRCPPTLREHRGEPGLGDDLAVGTVVALAHPDRIARRRSGRAALPDGLRHRRGAAARRRRPRPASSGSRSPTSTAPPGARDAIVRSAAPLEESLALEAAVGRWDEPTTCAGARVGSSPVASPGWAPSSCAACRWPTPTRRSSQRRCATGCAREGLGVLRWSEAATALRDRLAFLHRALGEPWPDVSDDGLLAAIDDAGWPASSPGCAPRATWRASTSSSACGGCCPGPRPRASTSSRPSGSPCRAAAASASTTDPTSRCWRSGVQEMYGATATPRLADGRVPVLLHLLSPAGRPAAVTADLASFWTTGYPRHARRPARALPEALLARGPGHGRAAARHQAPRGDRLAHAQLGPVDLAVRSWYSLTLPGQLVVMRGPSTYQLSQPVHDGRGQPRLHLGVVGVVDLRAHLDRAARRQSARRRATWAT